jgi:patatin-like phospholipase/acyl hydrolase
LALDGGGVRAIVQLKILKAIEKKMGGFLPIQRFFDLIGGTSADALVAFAIGSVPEDL